MIKDFVKEHKRYVQLLLVEHLQPGLDVVSQLLLVHWEVVLGQPVTVQDGAIESSLNGWVGGGGGGGGGGWSGCMRVKLEIYKYIVVHVHNYAFRDHLCIMKPHIYVYASYS